MIVETSDFTLIAEGTDFIFSINGRDKLIEGIRKFLAAVEEERALIQSVAITDTATVENFSEQTLTFKYVERQPRQILPQPKNEEPGFLDDSPST